MNFPSHSFMQNVLDRSLQRYLQFPLIFPSKNHNKTEMVKKKKKSKYTRKLLVDTVKYHPHLFMQMTQISVIYFPIKWHVSRTRNSLHTFITIIQSQMRYTDVMTAQPCLLPLSLALPTLINMAPAVPLCLASTTVTTSRVSLFFF